MQNNRPKVLILQGEISSYRSAIFNIIAEKVDLTIGYYDSNRSIGTCLFNCKKLESFKLGPFICIKSLRKYCETFDVVIFMDDLHALSYCLLPFGCRSYKAISWGFGIRASYTKLYDVNRKHTFLDRLSQLVCETCDASIFYMKKAKEFWKQTKFDTSKVFIAINTTAVEQIEIQTSLKKDLLFIGTLYKAKGVDVLLKAYKEANDMTHSVPKLHIIGKGGEEQELRQYVEENRLSDKIIFHGAIYDECELSKFFQKSLLCISPNQAGLSVAKSLGYGVPFVTRDDAITGGEKYHITNGENGILYNNDGELVNIIVEATNNPDKYKMMGLRAKQYYDNNATPNHMAQGVIDAINFVLSRS